MRALPGGWERSEERPALACGSPGRPLSPWHPPRSSSVNVTGDFRAGQMAPRGPRVGRGAGCLSSRAQPSPPLGAPMAGEALWTSPPSPVAGLECAPLIRLESSRFPSAPAPLFSDALDGARGPTAPAAHPGICVLPGFLEATFRSRSWASSPAACRGSWCPGLGVDLLRVSAWCQCVGSAVGLVIGASPLFCDLVHCVKAQVCRKVARQAL